MATVPSLLMVSWNRGEYYERTLKHILADPSDFRLYLWDNGSVDGVADIVAEARDPRIAMRHLNPVNSGQFGAWRWFMEHAQGEIGGKLDDDILGPPGWMVRFGEMQLAERKLGLLGGWVFLESEWDEDAARHKIVDVGPYRIFQNGWVAGCIFTGRLDLLRHYTAKTEITGVPIERPRILLDGYISGYPIPVAFAENLDDPRNPACRMNRPGGWDQYAAYTARRLGFKGPEEYGAWIAKDARKVLEEPMSVQIKRVSRTPLQRFTERVIAKLRRATIG